MDSVTILSAAKAMVKILGTPPKDEHGNILDKQHDWCDRDRMKKLLKHLNTIDKNDGEAVDKAVIYANKEVNLAMKFERR